MRRLVALALLALVLPGAAGAAPLARRELRAGVAGNEPPMAAVDEDGVFGGFTVDVVRALCRRLQVRCTLVAVDIYEPLRPLQARDADFVTPVAITEARRRVLDFTQRYFRAPGRLVAPRGRGLAPTADALAERTVGVQRGTSQDRFASATFTRSTLRRYPDRGELYIDLALGRLDAALASAVAARADFLDTELGAGFEFSGPPVDDPAWFGDGVGIAVRKGDEQLRAALDDGLRELRASGSLAAIRSLYPGFEID